MDDSFQRAPSVERISASIAGGVAALALVLAFVGIHGALAYSVARRHREIGVRVAIGATPWSVAIDVARLGIVVTCVGLAVGLPLAVMAAQSLRPLM